MPEPASKEPRTHIMAQTPPATVALLDQFGPTAVLTDADAKAAYTLDWRGKYPCRASRGCRLPLSLIHI